MQEDTPALQTNYSSSPKQGVSLVVVFVLVLVSFAGGYLAKQTADQSSKNLNSISYEVDNKEVPEDVIALDMSKFWRVLELIGENSIYAKDTSPEILVEGAISGLVGSLGDPYTSYYTQEANQDFQEGLEGVYEGIGAQLGFKDERLAIIAPMEESPAQRAGVKAGDFIVAVDGVTTSGWSVPEAVDVIRGQAGTEVVLTLARDDEVFEVSINRAQIQIPAVRLTWLDDDIAHVRVLRFGSDTAAEWDSAVNEMVMAGVKGIVLDVRNNPGGLLDKAIYLASEFFPSGVVVKRETNTSVSSFEVDHRCRLCEVPVVGLINEGSASASEILVGALQSRGRAELVGEKSFGKGTVQEAIDLSNGTAIHITTARWLLPNDQNIHDNGLEPDYAVEETVESGPFDDSGEDAQLQKAIELLTK
jgi:carboxyl-terminal processing protease